jgi:hypothetical protein
MRHRMLDMNAFFRRFADDGEIHEYAVHEIRHRDYKGPCTHLDDGACHDHAPTITPFCTASSLNDPVVLLALFLDNTFLAMVSFVFRLPTPWLRTFFCFHTPDITSCIIAFDCC